MFFMVCVHLSITTHKLRKLVAIVFACGKFHQYIYGFSTRVHTDHKPQEAIFKNPLHQVSPYLQRILLCLQKCDLNIRYVKGKIFTSY